MKNLQNKIRHELGGVDKFALMIRISCTNKVSHKMCCWAARLTWRLVILEMCETWLGKGGSYGFAYDWWAYGAIIFELLTRQPTNPSEESCRDTMMKSLKRPVPYGQLESFSQPSVVQIIIHVISILDFSWRRSRPHHWLSSQKRIKTIERKRDQKSASVSDAWMGAFLQPPWSSYRHHTDSPKRERTKTGWRLRFPIHSSG